MSSAPGRPSLLLYCQHSVGLGHLTRSSALAGALAEEFDVVLASGGSVPDGFALPERVQLATLAPIGAADERANHLQSLDPRLSLDEAFASRRRRLLAMLDELDPAVIVIEQFPFGRRKFARELLPLLEAARSRAPRPVVLCSVRDVLVRREHQQIERDRETADLLNRYFDAVAVHADPRVARLEDSFAAASQLTIPVRHLGYVVPTGTRPARRRPVDPVVIVSAGGGRSGAPLLGCAAEAHRRHLRHLGVTTRIVTGPFLPAEAGASLRATASACPSLVVEPFVPDLCAAMASASISVSQCGYNSALDVLRAGVPALVVPFGGDNEQPARARTLAELGALRTLDESDLDPDVLAREIVELLAAEPARARVDLGGAAGAARYVAELSRLSGVMRPAVHARAATAS